MSVIDDGVGKVEDKGELETLVARLDEFFEIHSNPEWNLWTGGAVKGNSTRAFLWREVWGEGWKPKY